MKRTILTIITMSSCMLGCNKPKHTEAEQKNISNTIISKTDAGENSVDSLFILESYLTSPSNDTLKSQRINFDCALVIYPTKEQIETMKNESGEDFFTIAEDAGFYQANALRILDSLHIKTLAAVKPLITFRGDSGQWTLNVRKNGLPEWNLIFFNTRKKPRIISEINLTDADVAAYFDKE